MGLRPRLAATTILLLTSLTLSACGGGEAGDTGPTSGLDGPDRPLSLAVEAVASVGGLDAPDWAAFGEIDDLAFDDAGNLYIRDGQSERITVVDTRGQLARTVGSPGEGPGELSSPFGFTVLADGTVAVFDFGHRGWVVYGPQGDFVRNVRVDVEGLGLPGGDYMIHPSGDVVAAITGRFRLGPGGDEADTLPPHRPIARFPLSDAPASVVYRAWELPPPDQAPSNQSLGGLTIRMPPERAFVPPLNVGMLPDGMLAVVDSFGYRVKLVDLDGTVRGVLERPVPPTPVTPAIQEAERQRRLDALDEGGGPRIMISSGDGGVRGPDPDEMRAFNEARLEGLLFAEAIPVIEDVAVDREGRIWVQRSSGTPGQPGPTDVITADGRYLGTLPPDGARIPRAFGPDGLVARVETDEFDVPTIVVERWVLGGT